HLLEAKIRAHGGPGLDDWIQDLAGPSPTPGGGSAAALAGALAAALVAMVCRLTSGRKAYAVVRNRVDAILKEAEAAQTMERALGALGVRWGRGAGGARCGGRGGAARWGGEVGGPPAQSAGQRVGEGGRGRAVGRHTRPLAVHRPDRGPPEREDRRAQLHRGR